MNVLGCSAHGGRSDTDARSTGAAVSAGVVAALDWQRPGAVAAKVT